MRLHTAACVHRCWQTWFSTSPARSLPRLWGAGIAACKELVEPSSSTGPQVRPTKCAAHSTNSEAALADAEELGVRFVPSEDGTMVAGMPVGLDVSGKQYADDLADKTVRNIHSAVAACQCAELFPAAAQFIADAYSIPSTLCSMGTGRPSHAKSQGCNM